MQDSEAPRASIKLRDMRIEDLEPVFALGERLFTSDQSPNLYRMWDEYEVVGAFMTDGESCLVATFEGKVVGFAIGAVIEKRRSAWTYGYLIWLGVAPEVKRQGVGRKLMRKMRERFIELGARMALVDTAASNRAALDFFQREGFGHIEEHVYMSLDLTKLPEYQRRRERQGERGDKPEARPGQGAALGRLRKGRLGGEVVTAPEGHDGEAVAPMEAVALTEPVAPMEVVDGAVDEAPPMETASSSHEPSGAGGVAGADGGLEGLETTDAE